MKSRLLFLFTFCCFYSLAQPSIQWQKSLGGTGNEYAFNIRQTSDSGCIVVGEAASNDGDVTNNHGISDYWIVKVNKAGGTQWQKCLGGSENDAAHSVQQTLDGGYVIAGNSASNDGDVTGNHGDYDYWIVKLNVGGTIQWQKSLGGTGFDVANSIQQTTDSGYIIAGYSNSNNGDVTGNHGNIDFWVVKLNSIGAIVWQKSFGGTGEDRAYSVEQTNDGGYIIAGVSFSNDSAITGNHGSADYWIVKINSLGTMQWQKSLGGTGFDWADAIQQTADSGYIVAGLSTSSNSDVSGNHGSQDYWLVKLNGIGTIEWQICLGGTGDEQEHAIQQTADGGFIAAGFSMSNDNDVSGNHGNKDYWIVKLTVTGAIEWQKCFGGSGEDGAFSVEQTFDGGYYVAGYSKSFDGDVSGNHGNSDYWVVKLSPVTGIGEINNPVSKLQIIPNPVSQSTNISFSLFISENISLNVYDITGRLVKDIFYGSLKPGEHQIKCSIDDTMEDGIYFLNLSAENFSQSCKLVVVK